MLRGLAGASAVPLSTRAGWRARAAQDNAAFVPVTGHPRLLLTADDLPRLQARDSTTNPLWHDGLRVRAELVVSIMGDSLADLATCPVTCVGGICQRREHLHPVTSGAYRRTADFRVSTTDPDPTPMLQGSGRTRTHRGYQDHYIVDGGKARIILAALVAPAEVQENQ